MTRSVGLSGEDVVVDRRRLPPQDENPITSSRPGRPPVGRRVDEILAAAITVFAENGYQSASMTDLAQAAGISKPGLYHHFSSKEEILVLIYKRALAGNLQDAQEVLATHAPATKMLRDILKRLAIHSCENQKLVRIFNEEEAAVPAYVMDLVHAGHRDKEDFLIGLINRGVASGEFRLTVSPRLAARALIGAVNLCYKWFDPAGSKSAAAIGEEMAAFLTAALSVR